MNNDRPKRKVAKETDYAKLSDPYKQTLSDLQKKDTIQFKTQMQQWNTEMAPLREEASKSLSKFQGEKAKLTIQSEKRSQSVEATIVNSPKNLKGLLEAQYLRNQSTNDETNLYVVLQHKHKDSIFSTPFVVNRPKNTSYDGVIRPLEPVKNKKDTFTQPGSGGTYDDLSERMDKTTQNFKKRKMTSDEESFHHINNEIIRSMKMQPLENEHSVEDRQNITEFGLIQRFEQVRTKKSSLMKQESKYDGTGGQRHIAETLKLRKPFKERYSGKTPIFKGVEKAENLRKFKNVDYSSDNELSAMPYESPRPTKKRKK